MARFAVAVAFLLSGAAWAEPRLAVHPLETAQFSAEDREKLAAHFDVMVARVPGVKLAGSARIDEALLSTSAIGCALRDSCLRFLAQATESLYGLYVRLEATPTGVLGLGRVVRSDGVLVRKVRVEAAAARDALLQMVSELKLQTLESTLPENSVVVAQLSPPPLPRAEPSVEVSSSGSPAMDGKHVAGWSLIGVGGAGVVVGGIFAGLAASTAAANPPDSSGTVRADRVSGAAAALQQSSIAAVLIPAGAAVAVVGTLLVLVPSSSERSAMHLGVTPIEGGLAASVWGRLP